jgi:ArsR family transcriptional regulator, arsenate/arsenite/antimonite-responsive transcriptional repressor
MTDEKVLEILKVISQPSRLEILRRIKAKQQDSGVACSAILEGLDISQSTLSHHITELCQSGLVIGNCQGRFTYLSVDEDVWTDFQNALGKTVLGQP